MATTNYRVEGNEIHFDPMKITKAEAKAIKKLQDFFGYVIVPETAKKEEKEKSGIWTAAAIQEFLNKNGTKAQIEKYWKLHDEPMLDKETKKPLLIKKDNPKTGKKAGEVRVKGHIATLKWFSEQFPKYGKEEAEKEEE